MRRRALTLKMVSTSPCLLAGAPAVMPRATPEEETAQASRPSGGVRQGRAARRWQRAPLPLKS